MAPPNKSTSGDKKENIRVAVRLRPLTESDKGGVVTLRQKTVAVFENKHSTTQRQFGPFDAVYGPKSRQVDVYREIVSPRLNDVFNGYNCTIFAYGQTGTGKTYTMEGERSPDEAAYNWYDDPQCGIIPRTLRQIFERLRDLETDSTVRVSFVELYNEVLYDLLGATDDMTKNKLSIYDDPVNPGSVVMKGVSESVVTSLDEVYGILSRGSQRRQTAATLLNAHSSRSHSVFTISLTMRDVVDGVELFRHGKLYLVDLAGSENIGRSGAQQGRAREAGNINQSLLTLGRCISALIDGNSHIPYRESKLTRLLQDSLGGKTMTTIIATLSPTAANLEETLSTLDYATRAKQIKNCPQANNEISKQGMLKDYEARMERLRRDLAAAHEKNGITLARENYEEMLDELRSNQAKIEDVTDQLQLVQVDLMQKLADMDRMDEHYARAFEQCMQTQVKLHAKTSRLNTVRQVLRETAEHLKREQHVSGQLELAQCRMHDAAVQSQQQLACADADLADLRDKANRLHQLNTANCALATERLAPDVASGCAQCQAGCTDARQHVDRGCTQAAETLDALQSGQQSASEALGSRLNAVRDDVSRRVQQMTTAVLPALTAERTDQTRGIQQAAQNYQTKMAEQLTGDADLHHQMTTEATTELDCADAGLDALRQTIQQQHEARMATVGEWDTSEQQLYTANRSAVDQLTTHFQTHMQQLQALMSELAAVRQRMSEAEAERRAFIAEHEKKMDGHSARAADIHQQMSTLSTQLFNSQSAQQTQLVHTLADQASQRQQWCESRTTEEATCLAACQTAVDGVGESTAAVRQATNESGRVVGQQQATYRQLCEAHTSAVGVACDALATAVTADAATIGALAQSIPDELTPQLNELHALNQQQTAATVAHAANTADTIQQMSAAHGTQMDALHAQLAEVAAQTQRTVDQLQHYQATGGSPQKHMHVVEEGVPPPLSRDLLLDEYVPGSVSRLSIYGGRPSLMNETLNTTVSDENQLLSPGALKRSLAAEPDSHNLKPATWQDQMLHPKINSKDEIEPMPTPLRARNAQLSPNVTCRKQL